MLPEWKRVGRQGRRALQGPHHRLRGLERAHDGQLAATAVLTPKQYADLLNQYHAGHPPVRSESQDRRFAGVPLDFIKNTLKLGVAPTMDVVAEHSYSQLEMPEINLPKQTKDVRAILAANGGEKPLWHTEQGLAGDDDGYSPLTISEADVASLYTRNLVAGAFAGHREILLVLGADQPDLWIGRLLRELHSRGRGWRR